MKLQGRNSLIGSSMEGRVPASPRGKANVPLLSAHYLKASAAEPRAGVSPTAMWHPVSWRLMYSQPDFSMVLRRSTRVNASTFTASAEDVQESHGLSHAKLAGRQEDAREGGKGSRREDEGGKEEGWENRGRDKPAVLARPWQAPSRSSARQHRPQGSCNPSAVCRLQRVAQLILLVLQLTLPPGVAAYEGAGVPAVQKPTAGGQSDGRVQVHCLGEKKGRDKDTRYLIETP